MRARIGFNRSLSGSYRHLGMAIPGFATVVAPGQFVMVRPLLVADPLLSRAFSIYRFALSTNGIAPVVEILYKVLGKGTQYLSRMEPGQEVEILGPLGNAFTVPETDATAVLVAGGIGVPPIAALARSLTEQREPRATSHENDAIGRQPSANRAESEHRTANLGFRTPTIVVFLGGKTSEDILCVRDFESVGANIHITTEDGSLGSQGLISDLLEPFLERSGNSVVRQFGNRAEPSRPAAQPPSRLRIYTCGPPGMLAAVARLAEARGIPCQTSVEANMACGFGACMGCAVEARSSEAGPHYKLVCKDGPVFDSRELVWR